MHNPETSTFFHVLYKFTQLCFDERQDIVCTIFIFITPYFLLRYFLFSVLCLAPDDGST